LVGDAERSEEEMDESEAELDTDIRTELPDDDGEEEEGDDDLATVVTSSSAFSTFVSCDRFSFLCEEEEDFLWWAARCLLDL
jgi:hypothetical protein